MQLLMAPATVLDPTIVLPKRYKTYRTCMRLSARIGLSESWQTPDSLQCSGPGLVSQDGLKIATIWFHVQFRYNMTNDSFSL